MDAWNSAWQVKHAKQEKSPWAKIAGFHGHVIKIKIKNHSINEVKKLTRYSRGGGVLPYMSYIGMCRCEGYGFQRVYSRIGYRNQRVLV